MLKTLLQGINHLCYPPNCLMCRRHLFPGNEAVHLCPVCAAGVEFNSPPFCRSCSRHLSDASQPVCAECFYKNFAFERALSPCFYNETMRRLLHLFKYGNKTYLRRYFSDLIFSFLEIYFPGALEGFDLAVPIPLHPVRFRERGYNQAQILAEAIALKLNIPVDTRHLLRVRYTQNQARITPKNRFTNIQGAFRITRPTEIHDKKIAFGDNLSAIFRPSERYPSLRGKKIILVDDLLTSGATVNEASKVLKEAGAREVIVLTLALAP